MKKAIFKSHNCENRSDCDVKGKYNFVCRGLRETSTKPIPKSTVKGLISVIMSSWSSIVCHPGKLEIRCLRYVISGARKLTVAGCCM